MFRETLTIRYLLLQREAVALEVYNQAGQRAVTLLRRQQEAGTHQLSRDGTGRQGDRPASGRYSVRLQTGTAVQTRPVMLLD